MNTRKPTAKEHQAQAQHNSFWANHFIGLKAQSGHSTPYDWVATAAYYSAIHQFQAFLRKNKPEISWKNRKHHVESIADFKAKFQYDWSKHSIYEQIIDNNYPEMLAAWRHLFNTANGARYNAQVVEPLKAKLSLSYLKEVEIKFAV